ncbi:MAG: 50S ribosomal protein P1 [Candidatus Woesearchaeota archaeon]
MEYVYAAMLLHKAGKDVTEDNVKKVLEAAGIEVDSAKVKALVAALEGVDIEEAIKNASVAVAAAPAAGAAPSEAPAEKAEEKKEEKKEEAKEEEAAAGLGALFG